jgi:acetyl esterase/lipase
MKKLRCSLILLVLFFSALNANSQSFQEQPLWKGGLPDNPVKYKEEKVRKENFRESSPSGMNRVFSQVSNPAYTIHKPENGKGNGVAIVICPGGGFRDVWIDREGNDLGIWLAKRGITSLVLKYRTYNTDAEGFKLSRNDYFPAVYSDAKQAIYILRSNAKELGIDEHKIGIGGFSAGGALALRVILGMDEKSLPSYAKFGGIDTKADFAGLFYPGLDQSMIDLAGKMSSLPPVFIMNGGEDTTTPPINCLELYKKLLSKHFSAEMHIYGKGSHGFDSGIGRGNAVSTWQDSFIAWLKDCQFIKE